MQRSHRKDRYRIPVVALVVVGLCHLLHWDPRLPLHGDSYTYLSIVLALFGIDSGVYWNHVLLHKLQLLRKYHKEHHEYVEVIATSFEKGHTIDDLLITLLPATFMN
eukprot:1013897_1